MCFTWNSQGCQACRRPHSILPEHLLVRLAGIPGIRHDARLEVLLRCHRPVRLPFSPGILGPLPGQRPAVSARGAHARVTPITLDPGDPQEAEAAAQGQAQEERQRRPQEGQESSRAHDRRQAPPEGHSRPGSCSNGGSTTMEPGGAVLGRGTSRPPGPSVAFQDPHGDARLRPCPKKNWDGKGRTHHKARQGKKKKVAQTPHNLSTARALFPRLLCWPRGKKAEQRHNSSAGKEGGKQAWTP